MEDTLGFYFKRISEALDKRLNAAVHELGLTLTQSRVLAYLYFNSGKTVTQRDIEQYLGATHATVSGIVRRLKLHGFIHTACSDRDRRAKIITLTDCKNALFAAGTRLQNEIASVMTAGLSADDAERLLGYLRTVYENVK